ncbi:MAG: hypothetical protein HY308_04710 [Gammaproteobacteria bacterium]|nr:hypothetical protein [Gammaproteobacteria bacterium]
MPKKIVCTLLLAACTTVHASASEKYPVPTPVWEVKVERINDFLLRYVVFDTFAYPCLRLETIEPISDKLVHRMDVCKFQIDNMTIDVRRKDLAGSGFKDFRLEENVFYFTAEIFLAKPGSYYLNCKVVISNNGKLSGPECKEGEPPKV